MPFPTVATVLTIPAPTVLPQSPFFHSVCDLGLNTAASPKWLQGAHGNEHYLRLALALANVEPHGYMDPLSASKAECIRPSWYETLVLGLVHRSLWLNYGKSVPKRAQHGPTVDGQHPFAPL